MGGKHKREKKTADHKKDQDDWRCDDDKDIGKMIAQDKFDPILHDMLCQKIPFDSKRFI